LGITSNHEIMTSNEKGSKKTTPQCDEVLTWLKTTNNHTF
jgi:hypothetical protein